jgi:hypothetical protein
MALPLFFGSYSNACFLIVIVNLQDDSRGKTCRCKALKWPCDRQGLGKKSTFFLKSSRQESRSLYEITSDNL